MNRTTKLVLMFAPLVVFFAALAVLVEDMRHPKAANDQCVVTAIGGDVQPYKQKGNFIYRQSENVLNDVSLRCNQMGILLLNDTQLLITPIKTGQGALVTLKKYRFLPDRWMVSVMTGKAE